MATLPAPHDLAPARSKLYADILSALADELEAHQPKPTSLVGIDYKNVIAGRGRRAVIAAIRFRAYAYRRRYDRWVADLYRDIEED